jgi:beta-glucosidase
MFDKTEYDGLNYLDVETKENLAVAKRASDESIVLLKNDGILPIDKNKNKVIAVIGPNADSRACLIGNYYGTSSEYITALEGIRNAAGDDTRILYTEGCDLSIPKPDFLSREYHRIAEAKAVMSRADLVVLVIGLNENLEGEEGDQGNQYKSGDKPDLLFPKTQRKLIDTVIASGKPFITVVMAGSAMDLSVLNDKASAILQAWYPGARGGQSIGDILYGKVNPSGKLPVTFYKDTNDLPDFEDYSMKGRTYRYLETEPLYPFGYGLTYGKMDITAVDKFGDDPKNNGLTIKADVKNTGDITSSEVVQVYMKADDINEVKNTRLAGFARITLGAGETSSVEIKIPASRFTVVNDAGERIPAEGKIDFYVGFGQPDELTEKLTGKKAINFSI